MTGDDCVTPVGRVVHREPDQAPEVPAPPPPIEEPSTLTDDDASDPLPEDWDVRDED